MCVPREPKRNRWHPFYEKPADNRRHQCDIAVGGRKENRREAYSAKEFYRREAEGCDWNITFEISKEIDELRSRYGDTHLYRQCLAVLSKENVAVLPYMDLPQIAERTDVKKALKEHKKSRSDRRDYKNIYRAIYHRWSFFLHDDKLCKRTKNLEGVNLVSWYLRPQNRRPSVRRGRGGSRLDW